MPTTSVTIKVRSLGSLDPIPNYQLNLAYTDSGSNNQTLTGISNGSGDVTFAGVDVAGTNYLIWGNHVTDDLWSKCRFSPGFDGVTFFPSEIKVQDNHPANYSVTLKVENDTGPGGIVDLAGASVTISSGGPHNGTTDGSGNVTIAGVPAGPCTISVTKNGKQFECNGDVIPSSTPKLLPSKVTLIGA